MSISLVQGASRGVGLQFCRTLLQRDPTAIVVATCRKPEVATSLKELQSTQSNNLHICKLDVTQEKDIAYVSEYVKRNFGKLDLLINCAGMLHPSGRGETSLRDVSMEVRLKPIYIINLPVCLCDRAFSYSFGNVACAGA